MIFCCGCTCGSTESLIRGFLEKVGYKDWLAIPIVKGKEKSRAMVQGLPWCDEIQMLDDYIAKQSKWAVIIGVDDGLCRWSDIAHADPKSSIEAEFLVQRFA